MNIPIRQATENDLDCLLDWSIKLHQHEQPQILKPSESFETNLKHWLSNELTNPNSLFLIADHQNKPSGFISGTVQLLDNGFTELKTKGYIQLLWVEQDARKERIAQQLLSIMELSLKECGIEYIECCHTANNNLAECFWQNQDYQPVTVIRGKPLI